MRQPYRWSKVRDGSLASASLDAYPAASEPKSRLERFADSPLSVSCDREAIDDDVDAPLRQRGGRDIVEGDRAAIHHEPPVALRSQCRDRLFGCPCRGNRRRHMSDARPRHLAEKLRGCRFRRVGPDGSSALAASHYAGVGHQQAQVVVHLRDGADGGARVLDRVLLLERDRGRDVADRVDVGPLHLFEEEPRVGGQGLHVAPLALGVERVEHQRRLAGTGNAGDDRDLARREGTADAFEVVGACA